MVRTIHTCKTGPSGLRPSITSYVMFTRYFFTLTGLYAAYIAGMLYSHFIEDYFHTCHLYIAKSKSVFLGPPTPKST